MKLGEALSERAALSRQIAALRLRIAANISFHEDEQPPEVAADLLDQADAVAERLGLLIFQINATNAVTGVPGGGNITRALARRDVLNTKLATLGETVKAATPNTALRGYYGRAAKTELKTVYAINVADIQGMIANLEAERRQLDAQLQTLSWSTDLVDIER